MKTYRTAEIAHAVGIHPNTVRLYEELKLIPKPERQSNGYRIFTDFHIEQFKLARTALRVEILQNGLRKNAIEIIKKSAEGKFDEALSLTEQYLRQVQAERVNAVQAITIVNDILEGNEPPKENRFLKRKETADYLRVTVDTLRNWEMNGLLTVKRRQNGYRVYSDKDIQRLKIIRALRCANYSLAAILRMLNAVSNNPDANIGRVINTPDENESIISVCDKLITSLKAAEKNAEIMRVQLESMKSRFSNCLS